MGDNSRPITLFVGGLSSDTNNEEFEKLFEKIGPLKRSFVVSGKNIGYVTFAFKEDAETAITQIKSFKGKKLNIKVADKKINKKNAHDTKAEPESKSLPPPKVTKKDKKIKNKADKKRVVTQEGRLIVRNLPFKAEKEDIVKVFGTVGKVIDVQIPLKKDGRKLGFGFVQFESSNCAANAIKNLNAKPFMGRPIAVDYAVPRREYLQMKTDVSEESDNDESDEEESNNDESDEEDSNNDESDEGDSNNDESDEEESESDEESNNDDSEEESGRKPIKRQLQKLKPNENAKKSKVDKEEDDEDNTDWMNLDEGQADENEVLSGDESEENEDDEDSEEEKVKEPTKKKMKYRNSDVNEGKTLFVRNLNFSTTSDKLKEVFSEFGELEYATICVDHLTNHSKGTGFLKFKRKEEAEKCLKLVTEAPADGGIIIDDFKINLSSAISKGDLHKRKKEEELDKTKSNRNLYLLREGMIRPGTKSAEDVSKQDLIKRAELEQRKRQMLKNLHIFVSKTRLCIRNLPLDLTEAKLRQIFVKAAGSKAQVTEARIMRRLDAAGADGYGLSKGYGFVTFTEHVHALKALRLINNNPDTFTPKNRPIVEFSLENMTALRAKQKRLERSKMNQRKKNFDNSQPQSADLDEELEETNYPFSGVKSDETRYKKGLPSHSGPKVRHGARKISRNCLQKQKKTAKISRRMKMEQKFKKMGGLRMRKAAPK